MAPVVALKVQTCSFNRFIPGASQQLQKSHFSWNSVSTDWLNSHSFIFVLPWIHKCFLSRTWSYYTFKYFHVQKSLKVWLQALKDILYTPASILHLWKRMFTWCSYLACVTGTVVNKVICIEALGWWRCQVCETVFARMLPPWPADGPGTPGWGHWHGWRFRRCPVRRCSRRLGEKCPTHHGRQGLTTTGRTWGPVGEDKRSVTHWIKKKNTSYLQHMFRHLRLHSEPMSFELRATQEDRDVKCNTNGSQE